MKLRRILSACPDRYAETEVKNICHAADKADSGSLFFCLEGTRSDGHDYAPIAVQNGAVAVVSMRPLDVEVPCICVADTREALAIAAAAFYGNPARSLTMYGITGTNGKTTTSYVLAEILKEAGEEVGLIGTNCIRYCGKCFPATLTTPDPVELHSTLAEMLRSGVTSVVMEVSAHALALGKTCGMRFDVAGFTNLSRDHLDFFGNMEDYAEAKAALFRRENALAAAVNADDPFGRELMRRCGIRMLGYGADNPADVFGVDLRMSVEGLTYIINIEDDIGEVKFALPGKFNMYNTLCAATMAKLSGIALKDILQGIRNVRRVDGRYNIINADKFSVIIDFAHTDDGLGNIITSVKEFAPARIITVFGCGGNRDKTKRSAMGAIAAKLSDVVIVTSDNPRDEEPDLIIRDIVSGIEGDAGDRLYTQSDRREAIKIACRMAKEGDIVLVAGKGAERYQEIKGVKYEYNDEEYIMQLLQSGEIYG